MDLTFWPIQTKFKLFNCLSNNFPCDQIEMSSIKNILSKMKLNWIGRKKTKTNKRSLLNSIDRNSSEIKKFGFCSGMEISKINLNQNMVEFMVNDNQTRVNSFQHKSQLRVFTSFSLPMLYRYQLNYKIYLLLEWTERGKKVVFIFNNLMMVDNNSKTDYYRIISAVT